MEKVSVELLIEKQESVRTVVSIGPNESVVDAAKALKKNNIGLLVVLEQDRLIGVISERDIVQRWVGTEIFPKPMKVSEVMTKDVETITSLDTIFDCYLRFIARRCRHLPILDPFGKVMGVLSLRDVTAHVINVLKSQ